MPDMFTPEERSVIMSKVKSSGTKIELKMIAALQDNSIAFCYQPKIYGKPDFVIFPNIAVFCDSSFWHGRDWIKLRKKLPSDYWYQHISKNRKRDRAVTRFLKQSGFIVLRFWDTQINKDLDGCLQEIKQAIRKAVLQGGHNTAD